MRPFTLCLALVGVFVAGASALPPIDKREILRYRSWDLRLFSEAIPTCNPNNSNINLNVMHNYGRYNRECETLNTERYNETNVKSLSWKSPSESDWHDFCMWSTPDCSGGEASLLGNITDGWNICYPYNGFVAYSVVSHGDSCV